ncbi:MAG: M56 family metallopeptidase [Pirellula sp.]|nr:M56 family metallopeptidase [Pirellula sp.]
MDSTYETWAAMTNDYTLRFVLVMFHFIWQGTLLAIAAKVATMFLGNGSASAKYCINAIGLFACPLCIAITFLNTSPPWEGQFRQREESSSNLVGSSSVATNDAMVRFVPQSDFEPQLPKSDQDLSASISQADKFFLFFPKKIQFVLVDISHVLFCVYAICVMIFLLRIGAAIVGSGRLRNASWALTDPTALAILVDRSRAMGVFNPTTVAYSDRVHVPIVVGLLRPMILLPASIATGITPQDFAAIISHELAHIRRYDLWVNLLQRVIESFLFFHPGVWYLSRRMTFERELCCDDLAVASGLHPMRYAEALLQVASLCFINPRGPFSVFGVRSNSFEVRVERIMNSSEMRRASSLRVVSPAIVFLVLLAAMLPVIEQIRNSRFLQPRQSFALPRQSIQQTELQSINEANDAAQEIEGNAARLTIRYTIEGAEDVAQVLVFDDERKKIIGTSDKFYGEKARISEVKNGSEIVLTGLLPGEYHIARIANAGEYSRTSLDRSTVYLKEGDAGSIEITRPSGRRIVGRVVNRNGIPLKHVQVWVCKAIDDSIWRFQDAVSHSICKEDGSFSTDLVSPGKYFVFVEGYERTPGPRPSKYFVVPGYTGVNEVTVPETGELETVTVVLKNMLEDPTWNGQAKGKQSQDFVDRMKPAWGVIEQGLQFGISHGTDRRSFQEGDRVPLAMFVRNVSNEVRYVSVDNDFDSHVVDLTDFGGGSIPVQKFVWNPSLDGYRISYCFSEMLEPGEVMAFRLPGLGLALPTSSSSETPVVSVGPANDRPNWLTPRAGQYTIKQTKVIRFGTTHDRTDQSEVSLSTGSIPFEVLEKN